MEPSLYSYSLVFALPLMLFFGFYFIFARTPNKAIYNNYLRSRRIMGVAMLLLAANYAVHFFFGIRFKNADAAILMNLSTYFLCYWLFSSALTTLLDRFYITKRRLLTHIALWVVFSVFSCVVMLALPKGLQTSHGLLQGNPRFQGYPLWWYRGIYQMAFHIHLLRNYIRRGLRIADIPAEWLCLYLDSLFDSILLLPLFLVSELLVLLRTRGANTRDRGRSDESREKCDSGQWITQILWVHREKPCRLAWEQWLRPGRPYHTRSGKNARYKQDLSNRLHQGEIQDVVLRMDYGVAGRICQESAHGAPGNKCTKTDWIFRLFITQLFYQILYTPGRVHTRQMEKKANGILIFR